MYLSQLILKNYRSCDELRIPLLKELTVFVGENNGGKSNAIDAIRLLTSPLGGRRDLYCESTDIRFGSMNRAFEIAGQFDDLSPPQQGRFISAATSSALTSCIFGVSYDEGTGRIPARPRTWAGAQRGIPEAGSHEMIRHVYLPPLRDARRALASGNPTRIYALLNHFLDGGDPDELATALRRDSSSAILGRVGDAVQRNLGALTGGVREQSTALGFSDDEKLIDIARDLRFKLADHGVVPEDLRYSGHGYANLLYMATIAVELEKVNDADLTIFLLEEPEAHLHPQLQAAVLSFLDEQAEKSRTSTTESESRSGELQIVVATHSPNLSAWVPNEKLVFFRSVQGAKTKCSSSPAGAPEAVEVERSARTLDGERRVSRCIPMADLPLSKEERRKIDRYLDVTKSALLFGGRVLLVEGIAEALLLPCVAKCLVLKAEPEKLRRFRSAVFVPIDGVDFEPYLKLLLSSVNGSRLAERLVVLTDGDGSNEPIDGRSAGELRTEKLRNLICELGADSLANVVVNEFSLETELVRAGNDELLGRVYRKLHPRSDAKWNNAIAKSGAEQASAIQALFERTRKGDFAQLVAEEIASGASFLVPAYIRSAIEGIVA